MVFVIGDMVCTVLVLVGLASLLFMLFIPTLAEYRKGKGMETRPLVIIVMAILIASLVGYSTWLYMDYQVWIETEEVEYTLNITMTGPVQGVLYVPISVNTDIREVLEADSANGTFSIETTGKGEALRVVFSGNVSISGKLVRRENFEGIELTMLDDENHLPASRYHWIGLDTGGQENGTVSVELMLQHHSIYVDQWHWTFEELDVGWVSYDFHFERYDFYYG